jgi:hypothetical protein
MNPIAKTARAIIHPRLRSISAIWNSLPEMRGLWRRFHIHANPGCTPQDPGLRRKTAYLERRRKNACNTVRRASALMKEYLRKASQHADNCPNPSATCELPSAAAT